MYKRNITLLLGIIGLAVSVYLLIPYLTESTVDFCLIAAEGGVSGCDVVRTSPYANLFGIPLPLWGIGYYLFVIGYTLLRWWQPALIKSFEKKLGFQPDFVAVTFGFFFSLYLTYLEAFVIHAWCSFCVVQAIVAVILFGIYLYFAPPVWGFKYRTLIRPLFFLFSPEAVHDYCVRNGRHLMRWRWIKGMTAEALRVEDPRLTTRVGDRIYASPIGLAAGFDYNGQLTHALDALGFGFESVGTTTWNPSAGNPTPRLGRLKKSQAILVNKGFRNQGIQQIVENNIVFPSNLLSGLQIGLSIGATNSEQTADVDSQIQDILESFRYIHKETRFAWFELNISCPNVAGSGHLASPRALEKVLSEIRQLPLKRPLWIKFPVELPWPEAEPLIKIMVKHQVDTIIIGNLVKDRNNPALHRGEIETAGRGNISGRPVSEPANQLISQTYQTFGEKINIVGLGGVFSAEDAWQKITLGASLVQLLTGIIYQGPSLIHDINRGLLAKLEEEGFDHISEAVGCAHRK